MTDKNSPRRSRGRCYPYGGERSGNVYIKQGTRAVFAEQTEEEIKQPAPTPTPTPAPAPIAEARAERPEEPSATNAAYNDYLKLNPSKGYLKIQAYRAREALPQSDVEVTVSAYINGGEHVFFNGRTNENGIVDNIELPAPPRGNSLDSGDTHPSATYLLNATYDGFIPITVGITVFEGIKTIQPLPMIVRLGGNEDGNTNT